MTVSGMRRIVVSLCMIAISLPGFALSTNARSIFTSATSIEVTQPEYRHGLAFASGAAYLSDRNNVYPSFHLEYAYGFRLGSLDLSTGLNGEVIFADQNHYSIGIGLGYEPFRNVVIHAGPGVTFDNDEVMLKGSIGLGYEFGFNRFSFGPITEFAFHKGDYHGMLGVTFGYAF
jgi:hypothetical protein